MDISFDAHNFYKIATDIKEFKDEDVEFLQKKNQKIQKGLNEVLALSNEIGVAHNDLLQEWRASTKNELNRFDALEKRDEVQKDYTQKAMNFIWLMHETFDILSSGYKTISSVCRNIAPDALLISDTDAFAKKGTTNEDLQLMMNELNFNMDTIKRYGGALINLSNLDEIYDKLCVKVGSCLDNYYKFLVDRHTKQGIRIFIDPIITDFAISIFDNTDKHGEIQSGKKTDELSAYTLRKAEIIASVINRKGTRHFIDNPNLFIESIISHIKTIYTLGESIKKRFEKQVESMESIITGGWTMVSTFKHSFNINQGTEIIRDLNPVNVSYADTTDVLTAAERFSKDFRNETLEQVVDFISNGHSANHLVRYILKRKQELREFFLQENSFYVCKIGSGNLFMGKAPGSLEVIPAERPKASLEHIKGVGFDEIKKFMDHVKTSKKWADLFLATSPTKTTDKSNVLMIGPQGCGKTEILRAVGAQKDSIGVFAQGSDFLTCWAGEADKNPKRMFEAGVKLANESGMHVNFLIDEIDSVMNNDQFSFRNNLTLEFQIIMDGVVHYPNLSVWGATNNPERMPMTMIRRFSKVVIVGELEEKHRIELLKYFLSFLPIKGFDDKGFKKISKLLEGATGDVIRKIVDELWRVQMHKFVTAKPEIAEEMMKFLNKEDKFSIDEFGDSTKKNFIRLLGNHFSITPLTIEIETRRMLENVAIDAEIKTAVATYKRAKEYLAGINHQGTKVGLN